MLQEAHGPVTRRELQEQYDRDFQRALGEAAQGTGLYVRTMFTEPGWASVPVAGWPGDNGAYAIIAVLPAWHEDLLACATVHATYRSDDDKHPADDKDAVRLELRGPSHRDARLAAQLVVTAILNDQAVRDHLARRSPVVTALDELAVRMEKSSHFVSLGNIEGIIARIRAGDSMSAAWQAVMSGKED